MNHISPRMTCWYIRRVCRAKAVKNIINNVLARQLSDVSIPQRKTQPVYQHLAITSAVMILTMMSVMADMENLAVVAVQVAAAAAVVMLFFLNNKFSFRVALY